MKKNVVRVTGPLILNCTRIRLPILIIYAIGEIVSVFLYLHGYIIEPVRASHEILFAWFLGLEVFPQSMFSVQ